MFSKVFTALVLIVIPAVADVGLFHNIRAKDLVTLVLPNGECKAEVVSRELDGLMLRLKETTVACGERKALVRMSRNDLRDVADDRPAITHRGSHAATCGKLGFAAGVPAGIAVGETTGSVPAAVAVMTGSWAVGTLLCRQKGSGYAIFTERIVPAQP